MSRWFAKAKEEISKRNDEELQNVEIESAATFDSLGSTKWLDNTITVRDLESKPNMAINESNESVDKPTEA